MIACLADIQSQLDIRYLYFGMKHLAMIAVPSMTLGLADDIGSDL